MKIAVVNFAADTGGALSILRDFYEYIKENDSENEWVFLLSDMYIEETDKIKVMLVSKYKESWLKRLKFDYINGKSIIKELNVDSIFNLQNTAIRGLKKKQNLYVHQSLPFQNIKKFSFLKKSECKMAVYQNLIGFLIKSSIKKCDNIIVQTQWMKTSILSKNLCSKNKINVVPPNIEIKEASNITCEMNKFFYPAGDLFYKNHRIINDAINLLNKDLDLDLDLEVIFTIDKRPDYDEKIKFVGNLPRKEVYSRYKSNILIFPSYIETYGLPLAECRASNGLVLAADTEFSREILAGYKNAYFFDYKNPAELACLMKKVMNGEIKKFEIADLDESNKTNTWSLITDIILQEKGVN